MKKALLAAYIFLCTGCAHAQDRKDTVVAEIDFNRPSLGPVIHGTNLMPAVLLTDKAAQLLLKQRKRDTVEVFLQVCDTTIKPLKAAIERCYSVREWHNEGERWIDWYMDHPAPPKDYPIHLYYLDSKRRPLKNTLIWKPQYFNDEQ